jgi:hypothetical protein
MATKKLQPQTPGAQSQTTESETEHGAEPDAAAGGAEQAEADELPPDLDAEVERRVAARMAAQARAVPKPPVAAPRKGPPEVSMADAIAQQAALPPHKRTSVLTPEGYYCPPGMGEQAKKD